ncbi:MAG: hypothetical protein ACKO3N_18225 [Verrucomicrobiota bacterium]
MSLPSPIGLMAQASSVLPPTSGGLGLSRTALAGAAPILLALLGAVFLGIVWAVFFRRHPRSGQRGVLLANQTPARDASPSRRQRRRKRRDSRPRNPTLAETGGLPPTRPEGVPPPPP